MNSSGFTTIFDLPVIRTTHFLDKFKLVDQQQQQQQQQQLQEPVQTVNVYDEESINRDVYLSQILDTVDPVQIKHKYKKIKILL
jgi:hypothetical protein